MQKALLISILAATVLIPIFAARGGSVKQAVKRSTVATVVFCVVYWIGLVFVYPSLTPSKKKPTQPGMTAQ
ncbi:MAG: hypothetical protein KF819_23885 [Labilithrix sp.]|nr:hypothetical protein [Labilithrix sp.]